MEAGAAAYGVDVTVVLDIIHVVEYVWKAAHVFHREGSPELECWAWTRVRSILEGKASRVAAAMRRAATVAGFSRDTRKPVDTCADYLLKYAPYLHYDRYLAAGCGLRPRDLSRGLRLTSRRGFGRVAPGGRTTPRTTRAVERDRARESPGSCLASGCRTARCPRTTASGPPRGLTACGKSRRFWLDQIDRVSYT